MDDPKDMEDAQEEAAPDLLGNIAPMDFLPWESPEDYQALEAAFVKALTPNTQLEAAIVRRIVDNEWDCTRSKGLGRSVTLGSIKKALVEMLDEAEMEAFLDTRRAKLPEVPKRKIVCDYLGKDAKARAAALSAIAAYGLTEADVHARAYLDNARDIDAIQKRSGQYDIIRRNLMKDYESLGSLSWPVAV